MTVSIVTDSTSDIDAGFAKELGITVVPLTVSFGQEHFLDGVSISPEEFYRRLSTENVFPTTTQPSPGVFGEIYKKLARENDEILVICISSRLSGTYQSALSARSLAPASCRVEIIDSKMVVMALGLAVIKAAGMARQGQKLDAIIGALKLQLPRTQPIMYFDTLKYLAKGGRIGRAQSLLGSLLSVKPILTLEDGEVAPLTRVRSRQAGMDYLYNFAAGHKEIEALAVEHAAADADAEALINRLGGLFPKEKIYRAQVGPVVGTYSGPGVVAVTVVGRKEAGAAKA